MAWIDDRVWCHPKLTDLTDRAFRAHICAIAYSSGFGTRGVLTSGQQDKVGATPRIRRELIGAGLWDELPADSVAIHDWDEHNGLRDKRREADRDRKRRERAKAREAQGQSGGQSAGQSRGASTGTARVEGSEGSEGSDGFLKSQGEDSKEVATIIELALARASGE